MQPKEKLMNSGPTLVNYYIVYAITVLFPGIVPEELTGTAVGLNNTFLVLGGYVGQVMFGSLNKHKYLYDFFMPDLLIQPTMPVY